MDQYGFYARIKTEKGKWKRYFVIASNIAIAQQMLKELSDEVVFVHTYAIPVLKKKT